MTPTDRRFMAASVAASYTKRILDNGLYRQLEEKFGTELHRLSKRHKAVIEAILYAVNAVVETTMSEHGALQKFVKSVVTDAPSELGARLVNGHGSKRREELDLTDLAEDELTLFLDWFEQAGETERKVFVTYTRRMTVQQLARFLRLPPRLKNRLIETTLELERPEPKPARRIAFLDRWTAHLRGGRVA